MIVYKLAIILAMSSISVLMILAETAPQDDELVDGLSKFSSDFYQECTKSQREPANLIISPFSVAMSLAFLSQATNGSSFDELRKIFNWKNDKELIANQFHQLSNISAGESGLIIANKIYVTQQCQLKKEFQEIAQRMFLADAGLLDFTKNENASRTINRYIAAKTNGIVKDIVTPDMFDHSTGAVLVNAITIKSRWLQRFWKFPYKYEFYISETEAVKIYLMDTYCDFWTATVDELDAVAVRMDYVNSSLSFIIILPNNRTGLSSLEMQFGKITLSKIVDRMQLEYCKILIPNFKVESSFQVKDILEKMGVHAIFDPRRADLSNLLNTSMPLHVDKIIHKTIIEINQDFTGNGTDKRRHMRNRFEGGKIIMVDHPFMYHIWDRESKTTIFSGRIIRPNEQ